jgi:small subunit ribosomal protein S16
MAVVLRLMRAGAKKRPFYRIVAADSRRQRDGRFIEILGFYDPIAKPFNLKVNTEKAQGWISNGAQPSEQVASLLKKAGMKIEKRPTAPKKKKVAAADGAAAKPARKAAPRKVARKVSGRKADKRTRKAATKKVAKA